MSMDTCILARVAKGGEFTPWNYWVKLFSTVVQGEVSLIECAGEFVLTNVVQSYQGEASFIERPSKYMCSQVLFDWSDELNILDRTLRRISIDR